LDQQEDEIAIEVLTVLHLGKDTHHRSERIDQVC